jgi:hypothetical protein
MVNVRRMQLWVKHLDIAASSCRAVFKVDHALLDQVFILQGVNTPFLGFAPRSRQNTPENRRIKKEGVDETIYQGRRAISMKPSMGQVAILTGQSAMVRIRAYRTNDHRGNKPRNESCNEQILERGDENAMQVPRFQCVSKHAGIRLRFGTIFGNIIRLLDENHIRNRSLE